MIEGYDYNLCPVIEMKDLERAILMLPTSIEVNNKTNSNTHTVFLDGSPEKFIMFDWDLKAQQWKLRNRIVFKVGIAPNYWCEPCKRTTEHIVNLEVTKKKCKICQKVSDF